MPQTYLKPDAVEVSFADIYLDPNNPRIAPPEPPEYDDPAKVTDPDIQRQLEVAVRKVYDVKDLEGAIETVGGCRSIRSSFGNCPERRGSSW
jgi:hypothetical protein